MTDKTNLLDLMQSGQFGPMYTPEQQEDMLRRQRISEAVGPFDILGPMGIGGAVGATIGRAAGRGMVNGGTALANALFPFIAGSAPRGLNALAGGIGGTAGALSGAGAGLNYADQRIMDANMPPRPIYPRKAPDMR